MLFYIVSLSLLTGVRPASFPTGSVPGSDTTPVEAGVPGESAQPKYYSLSDIEALRSNPLQDPPPSDGGGDGREGWYLGLGFGLTTTESSAGPGEDEIDFDDGFAVPFAIGHHFASAGNSWSYDLELEALYTDQDADNEGALQAVRDVTVAGGLLNAIVNYSFSEDFGIYAGGGIGAAALDIGTESDSVNDFNEEDGPFLAWQAKAGFRWWASDTWSWNLGYRFLNIDDAEIDDDAGNAEFDLETQQHVLEIGVRMML